MYIAHSNFISLKLVVINCTKVWVVSESGKNLVDLRKGERGSEREREREREKEKDDDSEQY